ncbi:hypothetical protein ENH_00021250 [Eimeria necatrix]|uniref:Uncharacterized protein n=1 Tax=Eimeria necatrix TaxID=51315 RepID=U6MF79_9EIME|nr:hypothetical protein ENH_00021250 [Eimeria necatrix]CDJ62676.1 hypothetical protein ENH_00021250 [Eimeria necatrix]
MRYQHLILNLQSCNHVPTSAVIDVERREPQTARRRSKLAALVLWSIANIPLPLASQTLK